MTAPMMNLEEREKERRKLMLERERRKGKKVSPMISDEEGGSTLKRCSSRSCIAIDDAKEKERLRISNQRKLIKIQRERELAGEKERSRLRNEGTTDIVASRYERRDILL